MVQAAINRLGLKRWRELLRVGDAKRDATALHRATLFGHRLRVMQLMLLHAPRDALLSDSRHVWLPYHPAFRRGHYQAGLTAGSLGNGPAAYKSYHDDPVQVLVFILKSRHFRREDEGRPSGHQLLVRAWGELGLGEPRVLGKPKVQDATTSEPDEWTDIKVDAKALAKLVVRCSVLDAAEALQGLGLRQGQGDTGMEEEAAPGSKRPRGG